MEAGNAAATRKVLKADREKLRRDKLNEQFLELGHLLGRKTACFSYKISGTASD